MSEPNDESVFPIKTTKREEFLNCLKTCPPIPPFTTICALTLLVVLIYGTLWGLTGPMALPGGPIFGLFALVVVCYLGGQFMRILKLPTLIGMIFIGFVLRNVPRIDVAKDIPQEWSANIRNMALVIVFLQVGLLLDTDTLKNHKSTCSKLIFIPFIAELIAAGLSAHYLFHMPWTWSFLMASMQSAIAPAIVLPVVLELQKKGIGVTTGIPTVVIAVCGIDNVLALSAFGMILGVIFDTGSLGWTIAKCPLEMIVGIIYGVLLGVIAWYIPNPNENRVSVFRFLILCLGGTFVLFVSQALKWGPVGALGCICLPFVAAIRWKKEGINPVEGALTFVWMVIEPFLFGLIGSEIRIEYLKPNIVGLGLTTLLFNVAARMLAAFVSAFSAGLTLKEQIFVTIAGLPKATVQAAVGPVALSLARKQQLGAEAEEFGITILTTAVLSILVAAPLGATSLALLAPRLLEKDANSSDQEKQKPSNTDDDKLQSITNETENRNKIQSTEKE